MLQMAQVRHFPTPIEAPRYRHEVVEKAAGSWWVFRSEIGLNGQSSPFGRVVFFSHSKQQACDWVARQEQAADALGAGL